MDEDASLGSMIATRWFWVAAAFFLVIHFGDWIKVNLGAEILIAAAIGLVNVIIFFVLAHLVISKLNLTPNLLITAIVLFVANLLTLYAIAPFVPSDFKGFGDYCIGAAMMVVLVGTAQSIPQVFRPGL